MSKFDRQMQKLRAATPETPDQLTEWLGQLSEYKELIHAAIESYSDKEKLMDWKQYSYQNAKEAWERKLERVEFTEKYLKEKYGTSTVSVGEGNGVHGNGCDPKIEQPSAGLQGVSRCGEGY